MSVRVPIELQDGTHQSSEKGTPQGGVISPLLANFFLHYGFDKWMERENTTIPFERYADDAVCHCKSEVQAAQLLQDLQHRMKEVGLELHPKKTKIIYCKDDDRRGDYPLAAFDFLSYTFRARSSRTRSGRHFINFSPAISNEAAIAIRQKSRKWNMSKRSDLQLEELAKRVNPVIRGWINYYGCFYKSALHPTLRCLEHGLVKWAGRKYKRLRKSRKRAMEWLARIANNQPELFAHWKLLYAIG